MGNLAAGAGQWVGTPTISHLPGLCLCSCVGLCLGCEQLLYFSFPQRRNLKPCTVQAAASVWTRHWGTCFLRIFALAKMIFPYWTSQALSIFQHIVSCQ